jgi:outer membrane lipoprotein-sorting protein
MFYSYGNKVYSYNLGTGAINQVLELPTGESVTKLKFNLYVNAELSYLNNKTEEFLAKQFDLIVASTTGAENGGIVRFYDIDNSGKMSKLEEYTGFGDHIVDVTYRERR